MVIPYPLLTCRLSLLYIKGFLRGYFLWSANIYMCACKCFTQIETLIQEGISHWSQPSVGATIDIPHSGSQHPSAHLYTQRYSIRRSEFKVDEFKLVISGSQGINNASSAPCFLPSSGYYSMADIVSSDDYDSPLPVCVDFYIVLVLDHSPFYQIGTQMSPSARGTLARYYGVLTQKRSQGSSNCTSLDSISRHSLALSESHYLHLADEGR